MVGLLEILAGAAAVVAVLMVVRHVRRPAQAPEQVAVQGRLGRTLTSRVRRGQAVAMDTDNEGAQSDLVAWRFGRLLTAGVDVELALRLAVEQTVDVHSVLQLLEGGCPAELAARIAGPLSATPSRSRSES